MAVGAFLKTNKTIHICSSALYCCLQQRRRWQNKLYLVLFNDNSEVIKRHAYSVEMHGKCKILRRSVIIINVS
jgi:hypothetical protein